MNVLPSSTWAQQSGGPPPLYAAIQKGDAAEVARLLSADPSLVNFRPTTGDISPLGLAAFFGKLDCAILLLDAGANPNLTKADGVSPLMDAANRNDLPMMRLLLTHHADTELAFHDGATPLFAAANQATPDSALLLLDNGAKVNSVTQDGRTPLISAITNGQPAIARLFIVRGADVHAAQGQTSALALALSRFLKGEANGAAMADAVFAQSAGKLISVDWNGTPLAEAFRLLLKSVGFAPPGETLDITDAALNAPINLRADDLAFSSTFRSLTRLARAAGQPVTVSVEGRTIHVRPVGSDRAAAVSNRAVESPDTWPILTSDLRFRFTKTISAPVLNAYLSRAVTHYGLLSTSPEIVTPYFEEDLRMLTNIGAKFIGRAAYAWVPPDDDEAHFALAASRAARVHAVDPEMVLDAAVFEVTDQRVEKISVPSWALREFGLPLEKGRTFRYDAMLYDGGKYRDHWAKDASVPDMTKIETQLYFYYRVRRYIDAGCEAIHFGQVHLMDEADPNHVAWASLLERVRRYAAQYARRRMVLCDAHTHGVVIDNGHLLFDYHAFPLIVKNVSGSPLRVVLEERYYNAIYGRSRGGITPSGWNCAHAPYICEIDSGGSSDRPGQDVGFPWVWGYDGISWFAHLSETERNAFLHYASGWLQGRREQAYLQPPTRRDLAIPADKGKWYQANCPSPACPIGANQEDTIRLLFAGNP